MIISGSEDGSVCGWDLNSQVLKFKADALNGKVCKPHDFKEENSTVNQSATENGKYKLSGKGRH
mgnify:CR=1 FL=1